MRLAGWLASLVGLVGVVVCNGVASLIWVVKINVEGRARDLLAVPDGGLEMARTLTDAVATGIADLSEQIGVIKTRADQLVEAPVIDAAAAGDLEAAIDGFVNGPYATLRAVYARLRERATAVGTAIQGLGTSLPNALPGLLVERLQGIDTRLVEIDGALTALVQSGAAGLAEPGVAARVSERAALAQDGLATIAGLVTEIGDWMQEARERLAVQDRRISRALTIGAVVTSVLALFFAGLNVLLFQQGRRWSQRGPADRA
jgi:hypothetical protein